MSADYVVDATQVLFTPISRSHRWWMLRIRDNTGG